MLFNNAARSSTYSFIDGFSGYNQIKMTRGYGKDNIGNIMGNLVTRLCYLD
jgi:hypothetical protein